MKIVLGHSNADFDAFACMVAITRLDEDVVMVEGRNMNPPVLRFLALHKDVYKTISTEVALETARDEGIEKIYVVDTADRRRISEFSKLLEFGASVHVFDHHPPSSHDLEATESWVEPIGACITILVERMRSKNIFINPKDATLFMLALYSDTGRLSFCTTTSRDIEVAAFLLKRGANLRVVNRYLSNVFSDEQVLLLGELLRTVKEVSIRSVEIAICFAEFDFNVRGAALVTQQVMNFGGHSAILAFIRTKNRVMIIGRSSISYMDIGGFLRAFGGGGHPGAGSASFKNRTLEDIKAMVLEKLNALNMDPVRVFELMSKPVYYLDSQMTIQEAKEIFSEKGFSGAPIKKRGEVVGVFSRRDMRKAIRSGDGHLPVRSYSTTKIEVIDHREPIDDALDMMTELDVGRLLVTEEGNYVGIITRTDLMMRLYMVSDPHDEIQ